MNRPAARCPRDATCPNTRSHDTYSAFRWGCTSPAAVQDAKRYHKQLAAGLHPHAPVPAGPFARRLQALTALGWRSEDIAAAAGRAVSVVRKVRGSTRGTVTQATARWVDQVFRAKWDQPGPSPRARALAARNNWHPAAAYDDIDNMDEKPKTGKRDRNVTFGHRGAVLDRRARIARLHREGKTLQQIGWAVGLTERSVNRHLAALRDDPAQEATAS